MGLRAIDDRDWLEPGAEYLHRIQLKKELLATQHDRVVHAAQDTWALEVELLQTVMENLQRYHHHHADCSAAVADLEQQIESDPRSIDHRPLDLLTGLIEEDMCLLVEREDDFRLVAGSVCAPSWWELKDKLNLPLTGIHAPVTGLEDKIGRMIRHFLKQLTPHRSYSRANWFLWPTARLCLLPGSIEIESRFNQIAEQDVGEKIFLRIERQTLRRLPQTQAIAFGIKVYVSPLNSLRSCPQLAADLQHALRSLDEEEKAYRRFHLYGDTVCRYLDTIR